MTDKSELQKLNDSIREGFELLSKRIDRINEPNLNYDENIRKISEKTDSHEQTLKSLNKAMLKLEIANEKQIKEFKSLAQDLKVQTYTETVYTDPAYEITDDEMTQCFDETIPKTTCKPKTSVPKTQTQNPVIRKRSTHENSILKATEALKMIENLNGINDIGVEEFIKSVKLARTRVSDKIILLRMIIVEKITDRAKQSIRFCEITSYDELFSALRTQVSIPNTVSGSRNKMQNIRQNPNETVQQYSNRFKQALNELEYAIQAQHSNPIARNLALEHEKNEAIKFYIHNLRPDLAYCIMAMQPQNLLEAHQKAIDTDIWINEMNHRKLNYKSFNTVPKRTDHRPNIYNPAIKRNLNLNKNPIQCDHCKKVGHTKTNCYLLRQNFQRAQHGKIPPGRVNQITETQDHEITEDNQAIIQENELAENEVHEFTTHLDDFNTLNACCQECVKEDDCSWTPEQE